MPDLYLAFPLANISFLVTVNSRLLLCSLGELYKKNPGGGFLGVKRLTQELWLTFTFKIDYPRSDGSVTQDLQESATHGCEFHA
jgi:hypothetical protein